MAVYDPLHPDKGPQGSEGQQDRSRKQVIDFITQSFQRSDQTHRMTHKKILGNTLWTLWETEPNGTRYVAEFELRKDKGKNNWTFIKRLEDHPPKSVLCPRKYLISAPPLCKTWRLAVKEHNEKIKDVKGRIRKLFKERGDRTVRVTLKADPGSYISVHHLDLISVVPLDGRYDQNGKRYSVPCNLVSDIFYLESEK